MDHVIIAGDFNFPGWNWKDRILKPGCRYVHLHHKFGEILDDRSLVQLVEEPTRGKNTLDLVCTSAPSKVNRVEVIPGISDHDCPLVEVDVSPVRRRQKPRDILLYSKANWDNMAQELEEVSKEIQEQAETSTVSQLWTKFKNAIMDAISRHIPKKTCKSKEQLPYITPEIKKLMKLERGRSLSMTTSCMAKC